MAELGARMVEAARFGAGRHVFVFEDGRFSAQPSWMSPVLPSPEAGPVPLEVAQGLLAAAMWSAMQDVPPPPAPERTTLARYVWSLIGNHVTSTATPGIMRRLRDRLNEAGRPSLAAFAESKGLEETGHDRLARKDIEALGLPADALVATIRPDRHARLVAYAEACVEGSEPLSVFGYTYALERRSANSGQDEIDAIARICPPGVHATRMIHVHSGVGADAGHVREQQVEVAGMGAGDRHVVAQAVYQTMRLVNERYDEDQLDDDAIRRRLEAVAGRLPAHFYADAAAPAWPVVPRALP